MEAGAGEAGAEPMAVDPLPGEAAEKKELRKKEVTMAEKLVVCEQEEYSKISFGKSAIHGWGLFARRDIEQGEFVIEYRGDLIRHHTANRRESQYKVDKKDLYLFAISPQFVVDATNAGSIGRFMNHSCAPSTMTKLLDVDGKQHLVFVARCAIKAGQELTYDYRLSKEADDAKILCLCGAPNCRGAMND